MQHGMLGLSPIAQGSFVTFCIFKVGQIPYGLADEALQPYFLLKVGITFHRAAQLDGLCTNST